MFLKVNENFHCNRCGKLYIKYSHSTACPSCYNKTQNVSNTFLDIIAIAKNDYTKNGVLNEIDCDDIFIQKVFFLIFNTLNSYNKYTNIEISQFVCLFQNRFKFGKFDYLKIHLCDITIFIHKQLQGK